MIKMKKINLLLVAILMCSLAFTSCEKEEQENKTPVAILVITPETAHVGETVTFDMSQSTDDVGCIGTSFGLDNDIGIRNLPFEPTMIQTHEFETPGTHTVIGYAHDYDNWLGITKGTIEILP